MTDRQAKPIALAAVRLRFNTAVFALEQEMTVNLQQFIRDSPADAHQQAVAWLEKNGFGPRLVAANERDTIDHLGRVIRKTCNIQ